MKTLPCTSVRRCMYGRNKPCTSRAPPPHQWLRDDHRCRLFVLMCAIAALIVILAPSGADGAVTTKSRTIWISITDTQSSDQTLTETMSVSETASGPSLSEEPSSSRTRSPTREISSSPSSSRTQTKSNSQERSHSPSQTVELTRTSSFNATETKDTVSSTSTQTRDLSSSGSPSKTSTPDESSSVTATILFTPSPSQAASKTVTMSDVITFSASPSESRTISLIPTVTNTLVASSTATRLRLSKTRRQTLSVTVTLPITFTITSGTPTQILTPSRTQLMTVSITQSNDRTASVSLVQTITHTLAPSITHSVTAPRSQTTTYTLRQSPTHTLLPTDTPTNTATTSLSDEKSKSATRSISGSKSVSEPSSRSKSLTKSRSKPTTHTVSIVPTPTHSTTDGGTITDSASHTDSKSPTTTKSLSPSTTMTRESTETVTATDTRTLKPTATHTSTATWTISNDATATMTVSETESSDVTVTATRTLTPPPTLTLTLSYHVPIGLGNIASLAFSIFMEDTPPCMAVIMYIGFLPFLGLVVAALYSLVHLLKWPRVDLDTFAAVKQWRSLLAMHSYFSILFPCHYHCAVHHALLGLIHYNLVTGIVAAIAVTLKPQDDSSIVIALVGIFAAVTPHLIRPLLNEMMFYYSFDPRDLHRLVYVDLDEDGDDEPIPANKPRNDGGEDPESAARKRADLDKVIETVPDVGDLVDSELSSFGDVQVPEEDEPMDERAFKALNSFVFHFTDDVGSRGPMSLKSGAVKSISNQHTFGTADISDNVFGDFTPLHSPRVVAEEGIPMDDPGLYPYMPISAHGLWKFLFLVCCFGPCVALNFILTRKIQAQGDNACDDEMNGFMKSLVVALILDFVVFQQAYLAIVLGLRLLRANEGTKAFAALHPYSGEMRPLEGKLLRKQMEKENTEIRRVLDAEQQRKRIEERLDLDDHIEIIAAPDADVPQMLERIDDDRPQTIKDLEMFASDEEDEEDEEEEDEEEEEDPRPQLAPKGQSIPSYSGNMMLSMLHSPPSNGSPSRRF